MHPSTTGREIRKNTHITAVTRPIPLVACFLLASATAEHCSFRGKATIGSPKETGDDHGAGSGVHPAAREVSVIAHGGTLDKDGDGTIDLEVKTNGTTKTITRWQHGQLKSHERYDTASKWYTDDYLLERDQNLDGAIDFRRESHRTETGHKTTTEWDRDFDGTLDFRAEFITTDDSEMEHRTLWKRSPDGAWEIVSAGFKSKSEKLCNASAFIGYEGVNDILGILTPIKAAEQLRERLGEGRMNRHSGETPKGFIETRPFGPDSRVLITADSPTRDSGSPNCTLEDARAIKASLETQLRPSSNCLETINQEASEDMIGMFGKFTLYVQCGVRGKGQAGETYRNVTSINPYLLDKQNRSEILAELMLHEIIHFAGYPHYELNNEGVNVFDGYRRKLAEGPAVDLPFACGAFCGTCSPGPLANFCLGTHPRSSQEERIAAACSRCASPASRLLCGQRPVYNLVDDTQINRIPLSYTLPDGSIAYKDYQEADGYVLFPSVRELNGDEQLATEQPPDLLASLNARWVGEEASQIPHHLIQHACYENEGGQTVPYPPATVGWFQDVSCDDRYLVDSNWQPDRARIPLCIGTCEPHEMFDSTREHHRCSPSFYATHEATTWSCGTLTTYGTETRVRKISDVCDGWRSNDSWDIEEDDPRDDPGTPRPSDGTDAGFTDGG